MKIIIETIPHNKQRYETIGDWYIDSDGTMRIFVSELKNKDSEFLVAVHELIEFYLCRTRNVAEEEVTAFDVEYEKERAAGLHSDKDEPGDDPMSPYKSEHFFATTVERLICAELGLAWDQHEEFQLFEEVQK